jgi:hypothetical protein
MYFNDEQLSFSLASFSESLLLVSVIHPERFLFRGAEMAPPRAGYPFERFAAYGESLTRTAAGAGDYAHAGLGPIYQ